MKNTVLISSFILIILLSSFLSTVDFKTYLFIHALTYIQLTFSIGFIIILVSHVFILCKKRDKKFGLNLPDLLLVTFCGYCIVRYGLSSHFNIMRDDILFLVILMVSYFYVKNVIGFNNEKNIRIVLYSIIVIGMFQTVYGLLQLMDILPNYFNYKLGGSFGNPGDLANFLIIPFTLSLGLFFREKKKKYKILLLGFIIMQVLIIIMSFARTAWIAGTISGLLVVYYFKFRHIGIRSILRFNKKQSLHFIILFMFVVSLSVIASYKLYNLKPSSANGRLFIWKLCTELIHEKILFGHGYNSYITSIRQSQIDYFQQNPQDLENGWVAGEPIFAFNDYLQITIEYGIIAVIILLFILYRVFTIKNSNEPGISLSLLHVSRAAIIAILLSMLFSYPWQNPTIIFCFFMLLASSSVSDIKPVFRIIINKKFMLIASIILLAFSSFLFFHSSKSIVNGLKWKEAYSNSKLGLYDYVSQYDKLYNFLKHDRSFILNYGSILYKSHHYQRCINHFEKYGYLCLSSDMYLMMGESYENIKNYKKAEESYKNASFLIPHLFVPKYRLFKLYIMTEQYDKANDIAFQIRNMKIKVFSDTVKRIKTEINQYLLSKSEQNKNEY